MKVADEVTPRELVSRFCLMDAAVKHYGWLRLNAIGRGDAAAEATAHRHQQEMLRCASKLQSLLKAAAVAGVLALALLLSPGDGGGGWWVQCWPGLGGVPVCASGGSAEA